MDLKGISINLRNSIDSAQDRDYWRAPLNAALNFRFYKPWMELVKSTGKKPLGRPRRRWKDNIRGVLKK